MLSSKKLDFWVKNNYNVLLAGKHGIGKTSIIKDTFTRHNLKWLYFSAATMDPWVDFIGIPKEKIDNNNVSYIELIKPIDFAYDNVEAIFFDEYNRAPSKVRNAVMELIQFKSINGRKYNNLKVIWAAINPDDDDDTYDVEKLDPAQIDRFHVKVEIPYKPDKSYFFEKYGEDGTVACEWWTDLSDLQKNDISPRRLDYLMHTRQLNGDMSDIVSSKISIKTLVSQLNNGPYNQRFKNIEQMSDEEKLKSFNNDILFTNYVLDEILKYDTPPEYIKLINKDLVMNKIGNLAYLKKLGAASYEKLIFFKEAIDTLCSHDDPKISKKAKYIFEKNFSTKTRKVSQNVLKDTNSRRKFILSTIIASEQDLSSGNKDEDIIRNNVYNLLLAALRFQTIERINRLDQIKAFYIQLSNHGIDPLIIMNNNIINKIKKDKTLTYNQEASFDNFVSECNKKYGSPVVNSV